MISFIVPAHDEERRIGACIDALRSAAERIGEPYEVVVVDDASGDSTASIAAARGARVLRVEHRHIARTRNSGAREAKGGILFFVDADTIAGEAAIRASLDALRRGAVGGGCLFDFDRPLPLWAHLLMPPCMVLLRILNVTGGCFLFSTREAFEAVGGFDERYFAIEDRVFIGALKQKGRFVVPRPRVLTSGRKARELSFWRAMCLVARIAVLGPRGYTRREGLDAWYGPRRGIPPSP